MTRDEADVIIEDDDEDNPRQDLNISKDKVRNVIPEGRDLSAVINKINPASVGRDIKQQLDSLDTEKMKQSILQNKNLPYKIKKVY